MSKADRNIAITINAQESATLISKEFNLQSSKVLNALAKCAGAHDFGALKAKRMSSTGKPGGTYALVKFKVVYGEIEVDHMAAFCSPKSDDIKSLEEKAMDYVLHFYDSPKNFDKQERLADLNSDGSFWNDQVDCLTKSVIVRQISKEQYDAWAMTKAL